jgi:hypothetical protein
MQEKNNLLGKLNKLLGQGSKIDTVDFVDKLEDLVPGGGRELESILKQEIPIVQAEMDVMYIIENSIKLIEEYVHIYTDSNPTVPEPEHELGYKKAFQSVLSPLLAEMNASLEKLVGVRQERPPFEVHLWVENVSFIPSSTPSIKAESYSVGDCIVIKCVAAMDCFLTLLNIGPTGNLKMLFPNERHPSNAIKAKQTIAIPGKYWDFKYRLVKPEGLSCAVWTEKIKAIATLTDIQIAPSAMSKTRSVFRSIPRGYVAKDLGDYVDAILNLSSDKWAEAYYQFEVNESNTPHGQGNDS